MQDIRAFTMGDATYFLGIVALLNSLRITGHTMPLTVLDSGMEPWQKDLLEPHCDVVPFDPAVSVYLQKLGAPLASDADIVLLFDSDTIVTTSLEPMIQDARAGRVAAFLDSGPDAKQRWFAEWHDIFQLRAPLRRERHVNAGTVIVSKRRLPELVQRWAELCAAMRDQPIMADAGGPSSPLWLADQDALNALLQSEIPPDRVVRYASPCMAFGSAGMARLRIDDRATLRCSREGEPVGVLHAVGRVKPWQPRARREYRRNAFTVFLRRLLVQPDVELRVPPSRLPAHLRPGAISAARAWALHAYDVGARATRPVRQRVGLASGKQPTPA